MPPRLKINGRSMTAVAALEAATMGLQSIWPSKPSPYTVKNTFVQFSPSWLMDNLYGASLIDRPRLNPRLILTPAQRILIRASQDLRELVENKSTRAREVDAFMYVFNTPNTKIYTYDQRQSDNLEVIQRAAEGHYLAIVLDTLKFAEKIYKPFLSDTDRGHEFTVFARQARAIKQPDWMFSLPNKVELTSSNLLNHLWQIGFVAANMRSTNMMTYLVESLPRAIHHDIEAMEYQLGRTFYGVTEKQVREMWAAR